MKDTAVNHIAIIMDGNGRWATKRGLPRSMGHKKGAEVVMKIVQDCINCGVKHLTLFVFSSENWGRPQAEIDYLMDLMRDYFKNQLKDLIKKNIKINVIGDKSRFPEDLQEIIAEVEDLSKDKDAITVNLAANYGGRLDITNACKKIATSVKNGEVNLEDINEKMFAANLYTDNTPEPEIVIRTGGESRISNFLLWQMAYSELFFSKKYWPDFNKDDLNQIIDEYKNRNRRFGKV